MKDNATLIRDNIFYLLYYSGITDEAFANVLGVSIRWLRYLKSGKYNFKIVEIAKSSKFFNVPFSKITNQRIKPNKNLRNQLTIFHKNNVEYQTILTSKPTIAYAIEFILIESEKFINKELEIKEIKKIFQEKEFVYKSSSLSNELKMSKFIDFRKHPEKLGINLYSIKNN